MKTAWTKNRNADSVRSFAYRKGKFMKSKVEFYKAFFEELEKKGFGVAQPSSPDYVVDIQFKGKTIAFYTKADMIEKNPFVEVPEKQMERLWSMARATASLCGICSDQPYEEEKAEKLKNGVMKLNEHNGVILACKKHPLFDYVLSTYKQDAQNDNRPIQRQYFYNREEAFESFATRSGLVDEMGLAMLEKCEELWVMGTHISQGMRGEIAHAKSLGIPIYNVEMPDDIMYYPVSADNHALLGQHSCMPDSRDKDYMGKILVMNYEALKPEYRSRPYQLWLATGGFGCSPTARGRRVFATSLYDGEQSSFYRQDFTGIIKPEVWEEVQSQYDFQITTQEVHKDSETPQEGMEP